MPEMTNIDEDDVNDNEQENEGQDKGKETQAADNSAMLASLERLNRTVAKLTGGGGGQATPAQKEEDDEFMQTVKGMLAKGYKPEQLEDIVALHVASRNSLDKEMKKRAEQTKAETAMGSLDRDCHRVVSELLDELTTIDDEDDREHYIRKVYKAMNNADNADFEKARDTYNAGRRPTKADFEKAVRLVLQKAPKDVVRTKSDTRTKAGTPQLDTGNSRPQPQSKAIGKDGKVDVDKLEPYEAEVYIKTLNVTKNPDLALKALKEIAPLYRR